MKVEKAGSRKTGSKPLHERLHGYWHITSVWQAYR